MNKLITAPNFRTFGGQRSVDGRRVCSNLIYRSEAILAPEGEDAAALAVKEIVLVCDLRSDGERSLAPNGWWRGRGVELLDLDILQAIPHDSGPWPILREDPTVSGARAAMRRVYAELPRAAASHVGTLIRRLAEGHLPALIHCTAGKDRTGFVSAVLLAALGVRDEDIVADYLASRGRRTAQATDATRAMILAQADVVLEPLALDVMMGVEADYLRASLDAIEGDYGGIVAYLAASGVDSDVIDALQARLLE